MANLKISEFAVPGSINGDAIMPMVQLNGPDLIDYKVTFSQIGTALTTSGTHPTFWIGAIPSTLGAIRYVKIGRTVTLLFPLISVNTTSVNPITAQSNLPALLWPLSQILNPITAIINNTYANGLINISDIDGSISVYGTAAGTPFPSGQICGFAVQTITYISAS